MNLELMYGFVMSHIGHLDNICLLSYLGQWFLAIAGVGREGGSGGGD